MTTFSRVCETPPASPGKIQEYFSYKLRCETDPFDVNADMENGIDSFALIDVRSKEDYLNGHAAGAIHIDHNDMTETRMAEFPKDRLLVVYCWGPGCNGATKAAVKLSGLGFSVKEMIGGITYWKEEGYPIVSGV